MDQTVRLIDQNQRAPSVRESRLRFLPGGSRSTMRLLDTDAEPPPPATTCIAMETAEVALDLGRCHITERGQLLWRQRRVGLTSPESPSATPAAADPGTQSSACRPGGQRHRERWEKRARKKRNGEISRKISPDLSQKGHRLTATDLEVQLLVMMGMRRG